MTQLDLSALRTPQERVNYLLSLVPKERLEESCRKAVADGTLVRINNMREALEWGQGWQQAFNSLEAAHTLACEQLEASDLLLRMANEELARVKALLQ